MSTLPGWLTDPRLIWFVIGLVLLLLEFFAPGLVIFFFGFGAWTVMLICFVLDISLTLQLILFIIFSVVYLVLLRRKFKDLFYGGRAGEGLGENLDDEYIGKRVEVVKEIQLDRKGKVELNGTYWDAVADVPVAEGETVEIIEKTNITLKVIPV